MLTDDYSLPEILVHLDCADCTREEWIEVGMALKTEGYKLQEWEDWSRRDPARFKEGECAKKWWGFRRDEVKAGTIIELAQRHGWKPEQKDGNEVLTWDSWIGVDSEPKKIVDVDWVQEEDIPGPREPWSPSEEVTRYLSALFGTDEYVGICTETYETEDGLKPTKGQYRRTAGELMEKLKKYPDDIGAAIGDYNKAAGAWVRFNPLDGEGVADRNVTAYRYALIESDSVEIGKQYALLKELRLPIRVLVFSGGKSLHAIVHVDAATYEEYRKRVDKLYKVCEENGLTVDRQNRNPSRLSRLPGVERNGHRQYIVDENMGFATWEAWDDYIEGVNDDLPEIECYSDMPKEDLNPELIEGLLREQHKMLISGPSKAGKSFLLLELAISIAEGLPWLGMKCGKGRVLYVNLELDRKSCRARIDQIREEMGIQQDSRNLDVWNLRGSACSLDKLAPKMARKARDHQYKAIIIDPIYKVITGDENSAEEMAKFCNLFDWISTQVGCAMIYCHHHSKGSQGQKKSMDRASGSGVFARDPDAILDMIELPISAAKRDQITHQRETDIMIAALHDAAPAVLAQTSDTDRQNSTLMLEQLREAMSPEDFESLQDYMTKIRQKDELATAWRLESTLREFAPMKSIHCLFEWPIHVLDEHGTLSGMHADGEKATAKEASEARQEQAEEARDKRFDAYINAYNKAYEVLGGYPTAADIVQQAAEELPMNQFGSPVTAKAVLDNLRKAGYMMDKNMGSRIKPPEEEQSLTRGL